MVPALTERLIFWTDTFNSCVMIVTTEYNIIEHCRKYVFLTFAFIA